MVTTSLLAALVAVTFSAVGAATPTPVERGPNSQASMGAAEYVNVHSCPGSLIDDGPIGATGTLGHWYLYYSPANGGTNCLYVDNKAGMTQWMTARLIQGPEHYAEDMGEYRSYAGSVRLYDMAHECVTIRASIEGQLAFNNKGQKIHGVPFHCG